MRPLSYFKGERLKRGDNWEMFGNCKLVAKYNIHINGITEEVDFLWD